ncbi:hypothetical protein DPM13_09225 [Paracoccus mutanolyticus]|uniref:Uncharacterized protein n=1 Tax=Paracoccus mutanolyticus TaxID=1499308 RepID=A0ABN5M638_9RHOB|nr:hypothetical protein DPM13_09225 [Paracoccus mutanolyticus]
MISPWPASFGRGRSLARPGLAVTLILTWVFAWNEYLLADRTRNIDTLTLRLLRCQNRSPAPRSTRNGGIMAAISTSVEG